jgi:bifunctional non-homologous end joining protein LigD
VLPQLRANGLDSMLVCEPSHRDGWVYEEKVDGWRILAYKDDARVRLVSRNGHDHTRRFAGIVAAVAKLAVRTLVLDGEVAIYDEKLRSRFDWLREPEPDAGNSTAVSAPGPPSRPGPGSSC